MSTHAVLLAQLLLLGFICGYPGAQALLEEYRCPDDDPSCGLSKRGPRQDYASDVEALYDLAKLLKYRTATKSGKLGSFNAPIIGKRGPNGYYNTV